MKRNEYRGYIRAGITAFAVISASILLFFLILRGDRVWAFLRLLNYILRPVFYGMVLAFLLLPVQRTFYMLFTNSGQKKQRSEKKLKFLLFLSTILSLVFAGFVIYFLLALVLPEIYRSITGFVTSLPSYYKTIQQFLISFFKDNPDIQDLVLRIYESAAVGLDKWLEHELLPTFNSLNSTLSWIWNNIVPNFTGVVSNVSSLLLTFLYLLKDLLVAAIVSVYLLLRKDTFAAQSKKLVYSLFRTSWADTIVQETRNAYAILSGFINGKLVDSFIIGIITAVCCNLFHFPYPTLIATIVGVTNIIPFFGPFIGAIPSAFLILLVSPSQCLYFILFILVLQQFDGNILGPKILGESTGLASFWVLFSILLFGGLFGFVGMVMGVPIFAMFYSIASRWIKARLQKKGLPSNTEDYLGPTGPMDHDSENIGTETVPE